MDGGGHYEGDDHHRFVLAELVDEEAGDRWREEGGEGQREVYKGYLLDGQADALHVDGQVGHQGRRCWRMKVVRARAKVSREFSGRIC